MEQSVIYNDLIFCNLEEVRNADLIAETSDYLLRMRDIKSTFVIGRIDNTCYFSLRNKTRKKAVGSIALAIVRGIGYGGGHMKSAGGQVPIKSKTYELQLQRKPGFLCSCSAKQGSKQLLKGQLCCHLCVHHLTA